MDFTIPNPSAALNQSISDHLQNQQRLAELSQAPAKQRIMELQALASTQEMEQKQRTQRAIQQTLAEKKEEFINLGQADKISKLGEVALEGGDIDGAQGLFETAFKITHRQQMAESNKALLEQRKFSSQQQALNFAQDLVNSTPVGDQAGFEAALTTWENSINMSLPPGNQKYTSPYRGRQFDQALKDEISRDLMTANQRAVQQNNDRIQDRKDRGEIDAKNYSQARIAKMEAETSRLKQIEKNGGYTPKQKVDAENAMGDDARRELKPIAETLQSSSSIRTLLETGSSAADKQVAASLPGLVTTLRATNYLYAENKNFGNIVDRLIGWTSQTFQGTYSENERAELTDMIDQLENNLLIPQYRIISKTYRQVAKDRGFDPRHIMPADVFGIDTELEKGGRETAPTSSPTPTPSKGGNPGNQLWADIGKSKRDKFMGALLRNKNDPEYRKIFKEKFGFLPPGL